MVTQTISSPTRKTPPGPPGYPLVGCIPKMLQNPLQFLMNSALEYGDVVHLGAMGRQQVYLVSHPDHVKYVLQDNSGNYIKSKHFKELKLVLGNSLVVSEGESWQRQRRLMQPSFHRQRVSALIENMTAVIAQMLDNWKGLNMGSSLDISVQMTHLTEKIVLKSLFSLDASDRVTEISRAWNTVYEFLSDSILSPLKLPLSIPTPSHKRFHQAMYVLDEFIYNTIRKRRENKKNIDDMLSMLLAVRDEESGEAMSDRELRDELITMFLAGFETLANALVWTWYLLSKHPGVERQLSVELATVLDDRTPTLEDLPHLKYTKMVTSEVLRLYPSGWMFFRSNLEADLIGEYEIPPQSLMVISPFVTHRLPAFWENPEGFDPERFAPEQVAVRSRYAYYPFGGGSRKCIGEFFAITEMQLIVAMIAKKFRLHLIPEHPVERQAGFTLRSRYGMLMTLETKSAF